MADIRAVILNAALAAQRAHLRLGTQDHWEHGGGRIDVFAAIDAFGVALLFRPMDELLGAFLREPVPGIIVSTQRPLSVRRYTAAHELGHFLLDHRPSLDDEGLLKRSPFTDRPTYDEREIAADAFAVGFLVPDWLVAGEMRRHGWLPTAMADPVNVYQLALRLGLSYEATCYVLRRYRTINAATCSHLAKVQPKSIKQSLVMGYVPSSWHLDVWDMGPGDDEGFVEAAPGDVLKINLPEHSGGGYLWDIGGLDQSDLEVVSDQRESDQPQGTIGGHVTRRITTRARAVGVGSVRFVERRPWEQVPLTSYQFSYDFARPAPPGLLAAQLDRLLGAQS